MHWKKKVQTFIAAAGLLVMAATPACAEYDAIVTSGSATVYADDSCLWAVGELPATTVVTVAQTEGGVAQIALNGHEGYAKTSDLTALSNLAEPVTVSAQTRAYRSPSLSSEWTALSKGTQLNLLATNGRWAMIERNGVIAYTNRAHLTEREESKPVQETESVIIKTFEADVTAQSMQVYDGARRKLGTLPRGTRVTITAVSGSWAYFELNGSSGYARVSDMQLASDSDDYLHDEENSVETTIYLFLTREMKLNAAVACGILANVERECDFNVQDLSYDGGYGICQWTGARNTRLKNWCASNGYDYTTLEGQLWYLKYELEKQYPEILSTLRGIENGPAGAYDAAYYFCYNFEIPASRARRSVERGNIAKDKYWMKYAAL